VSLGGMSKSRGISKSLGQSTRKCWKCDKVGCQYKKYCRSKSVDKSKGSNDTMRSLTQKPKPPWKEVTFTWHLLVQIQIMIYCQLNRVLHFI
jgi:hypothetical protein